MESKNQKRNIKDMTTEQKKELKKIYNKRYLEKKKNLSKNNGNDINKSS